MPLKVIFPQMDRMGKRKLGGAKRGLKSNVW